MWGLTFTVFSVCMALTHADDCGPREITNKTVAITGGADGIGRAIANHSLINGAEKVIIIDKNKEQGEYTANEFKSTYGEDKVEFCHADITTNMEEIETILKENSPQILINNAGVCDEKQGQLTLRTNMEGTTLMCQKYMNLKTKTQGGEGGLIVNVVSTMAHITSPYLSKCRGTQAGILSLSVSLGHNSTCSITGVSVTSLMVGWTTTNMTNSQMVLDSRKDEWTKYKNTKVWQKPDHVGMEFVNVLREANSGEAWIIEENKDAYLSPAQNVE